MSDYQEYPKTLYSDAGEKIVNNAQEERIARSCGWKLSRLSLSPHAKKLEAEARERLANPDASSPTVL